MSLRYFSLGNIEFTDGSGTLQGSGKPREFSIDLGYSRKLTDKVGLGVALRYINSDLASGAVSGGNTYKVGSSVAGDIGFYYDNKSEAGNGWAFVQQLPTSVQKFPILIMLMQKILFPPILDWELPGPKLQ